MKPPKQSLSPIRAFFLISLALLLSPWCKAWAAPFAYVANSDDKTVSVIDTATNAVTTTIPVGNGPQGVAVHPSGTRVYVTNTLDNNVSVIDTATNTVTATIPVNNEPRRIAITPSGSRLYVVHETATTVSVIDTATNAVIANITLGSVPSDVAVNPSGTRVYVVTYDKTLEVIDTGTNTVSATISLGSSPGVQSISVVAVNPAGTRVYVGQVGGTVSVIDTATNTVIAEITLSTALLRKLGRLGFPTPSVLSGIAVNPAGTKVYVTDSTFGEVYVIDAATNTLTATIPVGTGVFGVAVHPSGTRVYVVGSPTNGLSVIDTATNTVIATIPVGHNPGTVGDFIGPDAGPVQILGLTTTLSGAVNSGEPIAFTATTISPIPFNYKFWYRRGYGTPSYESNPWNTMQNFSFLNATTFPFPGADNYIVVAWATNDPANVAPNNVPLIGMNVKVNGNGQEVQFVDLATNVSGTPKAGEPITFAAAAIGPQSVYYKFWYRAGYGTSAYGSNPWVVMQDFSPNNRCTYSFPSADNYIVVVWGSNSPNTVDPNNVPLIGMNVRTESTQPGYRWEFDERSGSIANELSGSGHNGAVHGATRLSGFCGGALHFNGTSDYVEVSDPVGLDLLHGITMAAWIKVDEFPVSDLKTIASKDENGELHVNQEGKLYAWLKNDLGAVTELTGSTMLSPGTWYHVAMTCETYGSLKVYVNGVEDGNRAFSGNMMTTSDPFQIGQDHGLLNRFFQGTIDKVYLLNRAITLAELLEEMHCGTLGGVITEAGTGSPIVGARVALAPGDYSATTSGSVTPLGTTGGTYEIKDIPRGVYTVTASKSGYITTSQNDVVITNEEATLNISLTPQ